MSQRGRTLLRVVSGSAAAGTCGGLLLIMRSFGSEGGARVEQPDAVALELDAHLKQLGVGELWELVDALERRGHEGVLVLAAHGVAEPTGKRAGSYEWSGKINWE